MRLRFEPKRVMLRGIGWVFEADVQVRGFAGVELRDKCVWALFVSPLHEGRTLLSRTRVARGWDARSRREARERVPARLTSPYSLNVVPRTVVSQASVLSLIVASVTG
jgi:hypothetical protein